MEIIRVVPLAALPPTVPHVLDYFWDTPLPRGSIVRVMVGRRALQAIVLESLDIRQQKIAIKKAGFALRKLTGVVIDHSQITPEQLALAEWVSTQYASGLALALKTVLPPWIGKNALSLPPSPEHPEDTPIPQLILTQPDTAIAFMRSCIQNATKQVLILVPEITLANHLAVALAEHTPAVLHSNSGIRHHRALYAAVADGSVRLIISTRIGLFLPWHHLGTIIIEDPHHEAYKSDMSPRYATTDVARHLATLHHAQLVMCTPALNTTQQYLAQRGALTVTSKKPHWPQIVVIPMALERESGNTLPFSRSVREALLDAFDHHERVLLYSGRRAFATTATCVRCHAPALCTTCDIPLRYHRTRLRNTPEDMLVCYRCGAFHAVPSQCPACHGGGLRPTGFLGSQKVADAIHTLLDRVGYEAFRPPVLDSDLVKSEADAQDILSQMDATPRPWLIATQMIFSHRYQRTFDRVIIPQSESLTSNPDFRTQERFIAQLEKLTDFHPHTIMIQTSHDDSVLQHAPDRSWDAWFSQELQDRKGLQWPPYIRIVKLAYKHTDRGVSTRQATIALDRLTRATAHLKQIKQVRILGPTPALVEHDRGQWIQQLLIKTTLVGTDLVRLLQYLPPGWTIDVDPRSIT